MSINIESLSAIALTQHYQKRSLSPVEVTQAALDRIAKFDPEVNAFAFVDQEKALADARSSEARWLRGEPLGIVDGIPTTVKDLLLTKGWATLRGSKAISPDQPWLCRKDFKVTNELVSFALLQAVTSKILLMNSN